MEHRFKKRPYFKMLSLFLALILCLGLWVPVTAQEAAEPEVQAETTLDYDSDGYYTIRSMNSDVNYYLGVSGNGTATDNPVALRTPTNNTFTDGMKWKLSITSSGAYKITPKTVETNNRVLAVGSYNQSGIETQVYQRDYSNDTDYKDEWLLIKPESPECGIFLSYKVPTRSFSIQCIGTLTTGATWNLLIQQSATAWSDTSAGTNITVTTSSSTYTCEVDSYADSWYGFTTLFVFSSGDVNSARRLCISC